MNNTNKQKAEKLLKSAGLRRTKPRVAVLSALLKSKRPLMQERISKKFGAEAPNKVTIYRVLESLLKADIVHKAYLRKRTWHYELADRCSENQCHPHFTCTSCGDTHCFTEMRPATARAYKGFVIHHQRVQLEGLCPKCSAGLR